MKIQKIKKILNYHKKVFMLEGGGKVGVSINGNCEKVRGGKDSSLFS